jgi:CRP-like cAMP-binding protein
VQSFARGEALLLAGQSSRFLGVLLEGAASVQARKDSAALTLEELGPGDVFGEGGFFDPDTARTADVVARSQCKVALLPWPLYLRMVQAEDRAVAVMERNLIGLVAERMRSTDGRLAGLLEAADAGTWLDALKRLFGGGGR